MNSIDKLKLDIFESYLSDYDKEELIMMAESAYTIDELDEVNDLFIEKSNKEIPREVARALAVNERIIGALNQSEYSGYFKPIIKTLERYNNDLIALFKKGVEPSDEKIQALTDRYEEKCLYETSKLTEYLQEKLEAIKETNNVPDPDEVDRIKKEIDTSRIFKKRVLKALNDMATNVKQACKSIFTKKNKGYSDEIKKDEKQVDKKIDQLKRKISSIKNGK